VIALLLTPLAGGANKRPRTRTMLPVRVRSLTVPYPLGSFLIPLHIGCTS